MSRTRTALNRGWSRIILLLALALTWAQPSGQAAGWEPKAQSQEAVVEAWMASMSPAEKVGQLFIVAFWGRNPSPASRAGQLIQQSKVGGVVLITSNHNLVNGDDTPTEVAALNDKLQRMAMGWDLSSGNSEDVPSTSDGSGIPLFIAIDHEGDGYPYTRITSGVTPLPNPMAIGATWDTSTQNRSGRSWGASWRRWASTCCSGPCWTC